MITKEIIKAEKELHNAGKKYVEACKTKYGIYKDDTILYCNIVGPFWRKYVEVGGSLSMINE